MSELGVRREKAALSSGRKSHRVAGLRWWTPGWIRTLAISMLTMDEPDHTRLRNIVDEALLTLRLS